jgi:hypothetical protein
LPWPVSKNRGPWFRDVRLTMAGTGTEGPDSGGLFGGGEKFLELEVACVHDEFAGRRSGPFGFWAIPVELYSVLVGVAEVEGLAYAVVGGSVERNFVLHEGLEGSAEVGSRGVDDGEVVEASRVRWRRNAVATLPGVEADVVMIAAGGDEGGRGI